MLKRVPEFVTGVNFFKDDEDQSKSKFETHRLEGRWPSRRRK